jgi:RNA-directed DNA polymerase
MDRYIFNKWLKSGYIDKGVFHHTEEGTPQGGIISPTLMLLTLRGLEEVAKSAAPKKTDKVNTIAYADDFVITGASKEILETQVMPAIKVFLLERGLELSEEKTKITHISDGFDFLGFNIRKYKDKLLIKPAKQNVLAYVRSIKEFIKDNRSASTGYLIKRLNPKIRGWGNYYKHVVSSKAFSFVDQQIFESLMKWAKRRHPRKSTTWVVKKYYSMGKANEWRFHGWNKTRNERRYLQLERLTHIPIIRHVKIRKDATPYDPKYTAYLSKRSNKKSRNTWTEIPKSTF